MTAIDRGRRVDQPLPVLGEVLVDAGVPDDHSTAAVLAVGDHALVFGVLDGVVGGEDREPLDRRVERRTARYGPGLQDAVDLESEVVVQASRIMQLDHEDRCPRHPKPLRWWSAVQTSLRRTTSALRAGDREGDQAAAAAGGSI